MSAASTPPRAWPRAPEFDSTLALLHEGYGFGRRRFERFDAPMFDARIGLRRVAFVRGADAAAMFYAPDRFTRHGAIPPTTLMLLQDFGSVQRLDGDAHRARKARFLALLDAAPISRLVACYRDAWREHAATWSQRAWIALLPEAELVLCRAVCRWAGVPLVASDAQQRAGDFGAMIDGAGAFGPRFVRGAWRRRRVERWIRDVIRDLRAGRVAPDTPAAAVAAWPAPDGALLDVRTAAVELINLLRPTVAVARWIVFAAHAMHLHPQARAQLAPGDAAAAWRFAQEVRRTAPFFPMVGGRALTRFEWQGRAFARGDTVMLDLHATNHDPALWPDPDRFNPERFRARAPTAFDLIPQGAGDVATTHRCPGEDPAIALLTAAVDELAHGLDYDVPTQDLRVRLDRFPTHPASGFVMRAVRLR
jgi:fatty-acid peroxygenase